MNTTRVHRAMVDAIALGVEDAEHCGGSVAMGASFALLGLLARLNGCQTAADALDWIVARDYAEIRGGMYRVTDLGYRAARDWLDLETSLLVQ